MIIHNLRIVFFFVIFVTPFLGGCPQSSLSAETVPRPGNSKIIENVPFVKQKDEFCGPAAMVSVMKFYGRDITQDEIAKEVYTPKLKGALISDMENYAKAQGYKTETVNGDLNLLMSLVDEGVPAIVLVDLGKWVVTVPHYYVLYGYDKDRSVFVIHTGYRSGKEISFKTLDKQWEKMNRLVLILRK